MAVVSQSVQSVLLQTAVVAAQSVGGPPVALHPAAGSAGHLQVAVAQPAQVAGYSVWHLAAGHFALVLVGPPAE